MKKGYIVSSLLAVLLFLMPWILFAQETNRNQISSAPASARFEVIQSEIAAQNTFLIDKFKGTVYQMVQSRDESVSWQELFVEQLDNDIKTPNKVNYQIFTSGLAIRMTYLLNVNTGTTWQLVQDPDSGTIFWEVLGK